MAESDVSAGVYQNYLKDTGGLIKELALDAKKRATTKDTDFSDGYLSGFHRVVSLMQQQAEAFGITLEDIGLEGIDADVDLT